MLASPQSVIPPGRLAALLASRRNELGLDIVELSIRSGGRFTPGALSDIERGRTPIDDATARIVTSLYELDNGPVIPERSRLVVDLDAQQVAIGSTALEVGSREVDVVLERYLSLLYILRSIEPGNKLTLREPDLAVLSETLFTEIAAVERRLGDLMLGNKVDAQTKSLLRRFLFPAAGLLVAATTVGSLVIVSGGADANTLATPVTGNEVTTEMTATDDGGGFDVSATVTDSAFQESVDTGALGSDVVESEREEIRIVVQETTVQDAVQADEPVTIATPTLSIQEQLDLLGQDAEAMIDYDWQSVLPGWTVVYEGDSPGYKGLTHWPSKTITLFVDDGADAGDVAEVLAHELGHALDVTYLDNDTRTEWLEARGMPMVWWAGNGLNDFSVGAGDFAEAVASLWVDSPSDSAYGDFTQAQLDLVSELLPDA